MKKPLRTLSVVRWLLACLTALLLYVPAPAQPLGISVVKDIIPERDGNGGLSSQPNQLAATSRYLFFTAYVTASDFSVRGLYATNGTEAGTVLLKTYVDQRTGEGRIEDVQVINDRFYFVFARELWTSDGTPGGTRRIAAINIPATRTDPGDIRLIGGVGNRILFRVRSTLEAQLWSSDGTEAGTTRLATVEVESYETKKALANLNGKAYFVSMAQPPGSVGGVTGINGVPGILWETDGTPEGTRNLTGLDLRFSSPPVVFNNRLYLYGLTTNTTPDQVTGVLRLYQTDGTAAGITMIKEIPYSTTLRRFSIIRQLPVVSNGFYFVTPDRNLYKSNGTATGTELLGAISSSVDPGYPGDALSSFTTVGNTLYFVRNLIDIRSRISTEFELWKSDGTPAGTGLVARLISSEGDMSVPVTLISFNGKVYFRARSQVAGLELWESNGTAAGTQLAASIYPGPESSSPDDLTIFRNGLYFSARTLAYGRELMSVPGPATEPVGEPLTLLEPVYSCLSGRVTVGFLDVQISGGDGTPVEYRVAGLRDWDTAPRFNVPPHQLEGTTFVIEARQSGRVVQRTYTTVCTNFSSQSLAIDDIVYDCNTRQLRVIASGINPSAPVEYQLLPVAPYQSSPVFQAGQAGFENTVLDVFVRQNGVVVRRTFRVPFCDPTRLVIKTTDYNCTTGDLEVVAAGNDGNPKEYRIVGLRDWSPDPVFNIPVWQRQNVLFTVEVRMGSQYQSQSFLSQPCSGAQARTGAEGQKEGTGLVLTTGRNPVTDKLDVEVRGAGNQPLVLTLTDLTGRPVATRRIDQPAAVERQTFDLSHQAAGALILRAATAAQSQTLRILKN